MEWLWFALASLLGIIWAFVKGRSEGREQAEGEQAKEVLDNVAKAKSVADDVRATPADERRERLRKYTD